MLTFKTVSTLHREVKRLSQYLRVVHRLGYVFFFNITFENVKYIHLFWEKNFWLQSPHYDGLYC